MKNNTHVWWQIAFNTISDRCLWSKVMWCTIFDHQLFCWANFEKQQMFNCWLHINRHIPPLMDYFSFSLSLSVFLKCCFICSLFLHIALFPVLTKDKMDLPLAWLEFGFSSKHHFTLKWLILPENHSVTHLLFVHVQCTCIRTHS